MERGLQTLLLVLIAGLLAIMALRTGGPVKLQWDGPIQSGGAMGIPLALNTDGEARFQVSTEATPGGGVHIVQHDTFTGRITVYLLTSNGKLQRLDQSE